MSRAGLKQLSLVSWLDLTAKEREITRELFGIRGFYRDHVTGPSPKRKLKWCLATVG